MRISAFCMIWQGRLSFFNCENCVKNLDSNYIMVYNYTNVLSKNMENNFFDTIFEIFIQNNGGERIYEIQKTR